MNFHGKDIKIFSCNSNISVATQMAEALGLKVGNADVKHFSDGEIAVSINESVRGSDVFIVQSTCAPDSVFFRKKNNEHHYQSFFLPSLYSCFLLPKLSL